MTIEAAIYAALMEHPLIEDRVAGRIFPNGQVKQDANYPQMTQEVLNTLRPGTLSGPCPSTSYTVQVVAWAVTKAEVDEIMAAVDEQLDFRKNGHIRGCTHSDFQSEPLPETPNVYADSSTWTVWFVR